MAGDFELRTKYQFLGLIEKRNRLGTLKDDPSALHRFDHLVGIEWARQNCALEDYLCKSSKVQGPFESGALTPSPGLPGTVPVPRGFSSPQPSSPVSEESMAALRRLPAEGDHRIRFALPNTDSDPELWQRETLDEGRLLQLARHTDAARWLVHHSRTKNTLSSSDLLETHRLMLEGIALSAGKFRESEIKPLGVGHEPTEPEMIPSVTENALEWFSSDSFQEMHEVEKTALVLIKLIDIWPFEEGNGRTLRLFANIFLLKAGYPPAIIPPERASQYAVAIQHSLRFHTQPLIDLLTDSVDRGLHYCLGEAVPPPSLPVLH